MHHCACKKTMHHCTYRQVRRQRMKRKQIDRIHTIPKHSHTRRKILKNALRARNHREAIVHHNHTGEESKNHARVNVRDTAGNPIQNYFDYDKHELQHYSAVTRCQIKFARIQKSRPRARGCRATVNNLHFHNVTKKCRISLFVYNNVGYPYKE